MRKLIMIFLSIVFIILAGKTSAAKPGDQIDIKPLNSSIIYVDDYETDIKKYHYKGKTVLIYWKVLKSQENLIGRYIYPPKKDKEIFHIMESLAIITYIEYCTDMKILNAIFDNETKKIDIRKLTIEINRQIKTAEKLLEVTKHLKFYKSFEEVKINSILCSFLVKKIAVYKHFKWYFKSNMDEKSRKVLVERLRKIFPNSKSFENAAKKFLEESEFTPLHNFNLRLINILNKKDLTVIRKISKSFSRNYYKQIIPLFEVRYPNQNFKCIHKKSP